MVVSSESACKYPRYQPSGAEVRVITTEANRPDHRTLADWDNSLTETLHVGLPSRQKQARARTSHIDRASAIAKRLMPTTDPVPDTSFPVTISSSPIPIKTINPPLPITDGAPNINCRTDNSTTIITKYQPAIAVR
jgi:hypothetical protein